MKKKPATLKPNIRSILDAIPSLIFLMGSDLKVIDGNRSALKVIGDKPEMVIRHSYGEIFHCVHEKDALDGCGTTEFCSDCVVRVTIEKALQGNVAQRERHRMKIEENGRIHDVFYLVTASPFEYEGSASVLLILEDITELMTLRHLIPICAGCKKVRNDQEFWEEVETYLEKHAQLEFTHGLCPDCIKKYFPVEED